MKTNINDTTAVQLDWLVARAMKLKGVRILPAWRNKHGAWGNAQVMVSDGAGGSYWFNPTDWAQGGPIIEREMISIDFDADPECGGPCAASTRDAPCYWVGPTPLVAAMRCYVASKLGDELEVPEELGGENHASPS